MKNKISPIGLLSIAFFPFILGSIINAFFRNDILTWISLLSSLIFCYFNLVKSIENYAKKVFIFFSFFGFILTLFASYFALKLEGYETFKSIVEFTTTDKHNSDLIGISIVINKFNSLFKEEGLLSATTFPYALMAFYNNIISPLKFGYAITSMPGIGYYALAIEAWWFNLIFYIICIYLYPININNKKANIFFAIFLPFLILPFAVPYDRESIVIFPISIFVFMIIEKSKINFSNLLAIFLCLFLIFAHRVGYAPLIPLLFMFFFLFRFEFFIKYFTNFSSSKALIIFIIFIFSTSYFKQLFLLIGGSLGITATAFDLLLSFDGSNQDTWQQFTTGISVIDNLVKTFFLLITPFPFFQLFKSDNDGTFIIRSVYISISIIPIFMIGKAFIASMFIKRISNGNNTNLFLFIFSLLFLLPILTTPRTGPAYLIPSLSLMVIFLITNGIKLKLFKNSMNIYLISMFILHIAYLIVYRRF
jgi:hypothetical protein